MSSWTSFACTSTLDGFACSTEHLDRKSISHWILRGKWKWFAAVQKSIWRPKTLTEKLARKNLKQSRCSLCFAYVFSFSSMLHWCSGYLGCWLHYGRDGAAQNPFSREGLYPCSASSCLLGLCAVLCKQSRVLPCIGLSACDSASRTLRCLHVPVTSVASTSMHPVPYVCVCVFDFLFFICKIFGILIWLSFHFSVDVWSVGCIMAEMVRGSVLFPGTDRILTWSSLLSHSKCCLFLLFSYFTLDVCFVIDVRDLMKRR